MPAPLATRARQSRGLALVRQLGSLGVARLLASERQEDTVLTLSTHRLQKCSETMSCLCVHVSFCLGAGE